MNVLTDSARQVLQQRHIVGEHEIGNLLLALRRQIPDLVVLDLLMPQMNGFELAQEIKKRYDLPIIVLTSVTDGLATTVTAVSVGSQPV
ncbi:MAG: response regulator, partial [Anaerolineaceae bacterium]|nr:response regulator [Anaerolineaceae bacterium]